jgi:hypothetical protein
MVLTQLSLQGSGIWLLLGLIANTLLLLFRRQIAPGWRDRCAIAIWIGIPYLGLLLGGLSPRLIGLSTIDWLSSLGLGLGLLFVMLVLLVLVRATTNTPGADDPPARTDLATYLYQVMQHGAEEFYWCFLRGALWEFIQMLPNPPALPAYWAVWLAALLALPEALFWPIHTAQRLLSLVVLIATTVLFFYTRNFWLCWLLHTAAWFIVNPQRAPDATSALLTK